MCDSCHSDSNSCSIHSVVDYVTYRDSSKGSLYIRTLVSTFNKQTGGKHATELSEQVTALYFMSNFELTVIISKMYDGIYVQGLEPR